jgi:hypothetical protein
MNENFQWMHNCIYNFIREFLKCLDVYFLFIKNIYICPMHILWKMPYPANTGSGTPWGLTLWGAPPSGERTCRGTSCTTLTLAKVLESSVLPKKETRGRRRRRSRWSFVIPIIHY